MSPFLIAHLCLVSAGFTNESSLAVAAFDLVYTAPSVLLFVVMLLYPLVINIVSFMAPFKSCGHFIASPHQRMKC